VKIAGSILAEGMSGYETSSSPCCRFTSCAIAPNIGGILDSANPREPTIFMYDRYPGGLGYAERGYAIIGSCCRVAPPRRGLPMRAADVLHVWGSQSCAPRNNKTPTCTAAGRFQQGRDDALLRRMLGR